MTRLEPCPSRVDGGHQDADGSEAAGGIRYRLPAEWEPHEATWLIWPGHHRMVPHWHGHENELRSFYHSLIATMGRFERLHVLLSRGMQDPPRTMSSEGGIMQVASIESDDIWLRDTAPTFLIPTQPSQGLRQAPLRALCGRWQAYGGIYHPCQKDAQIANQLAAHIQCQQIPLPFVLEGGAFDSDGSGTVLASQRSIACDKRNPGLSRSHLQALIQAHLGVERVIWIDACLQGDDTNGHVDQLARFVAPGRVLVANQPDPLDQDHSMLRSLQQMLRASRDATGRLLEVIPVDLPAAQFCGQRRLPASYLNFYIGNHGVYVPAFGCSADGEAAKILRRCFPGRHIIPIDCRVVIHGGGALHCISRQQPALAGSLNLCHNDDHGLNG